jgi:hypothetical protein
MGRHVELLRPEDACTAIGYERTRADEDGGRSDDE